MGELTGKQIGFAAALLTLAVFADRAAATQEIHGAVATGDARQVEALLAADPALVDARDNRGRTPLHIAAGRGNRDLVELLLARGADVNAIAGEGPRSQSVVGVAFMSERMRGQADLTRYPVSQGAVFDPNASIGPANRLIATVAVGNAAMVRFLIESGADVNAESPFPYKPLASAAHTGSLEIARLLLESGAEVNARDEEGNPALKWAVERGHEPIVALLLDAGADVAFTDPQNGATLLHLATLGGHVGVVDLMLAHGVEPDDRDAEGRTALYYAARYGHERVYARLVGRGATEDPGLEKRFGTSPELARELAGNEAVAWYLTHRGWAVKTRGHLLVFDPEEFGVTRPADPSLANGFLTPEEIGDQDVIALYTAYHGEVGEPAYIHEIEASLRSVTYVHNAGDRWRGSEQTVYLSPRDATTVDDVEIVTVAVTETMTSLGYLVTVDDLVIYYAGFRAENVGNFERELEFLRQHTDRVDLAFLPSIEPGDQGTGAEMFLEEFEPGAWFVLDPDRREHLFSEMDEWVKSRGLATQVFAAGHAGDVFTYRPRRR